MLEECSSEYFQCTKGGRLRRPLLSVAAEGKRKGSRRQGSGRRSRTIGAAGFDVGSGLAGAAVTDGDGISAVRAGRVGARAVRGRCEMLACGLVFRPSPLTAPPRRTRPLCSAQEDDGGVVLR